MERGREVGKERKRERGREGGRGKEREGRWEAKGKGGKMEERRRARWGNEYDSVVL